MKLKTNIVDLCGRLLCCLTRMVDSSLCNLVKLLTIDSIGQDSCNGSGTVISEQRALVPGFDFEVSLV